MNCDRRQLQVFPNAATKTAQEAAGLDLTGLPMAAADDAVEREVIMSIAAARAGHDPEARHVYIGDGLWDMRAAATLGWHFIGIGPSGCTLEQKGVRRLVPHFKDAGYVYELLGASGGWQRA